MSSIQTWTAAPTYTWANLPAAGTAGRQAFVSNAGTKGSFWYDDGTRWKPVGGSVVLATMDSASSAINNAETNVWNPLIPAGLWQTGDRLRLYFTYAKSGTTDVGKLTVRCGTAGTFDTMITNINYMAAANRHTGTIMEYRLESATSVQPLSHTTLVLGYEQASGNAIASPVAISSAAANALYLSITIYSAGTTDTVQLVDAQLQLIAKAN